MILDEKLIEPHLKEKCLKFNKGVGAIKKTAKYLAEASTFNNL